MIDDYFEEFIIMDRVSHADEYAGISYTYEEGARFLAGCAMNNSSPVQVAYRQGAKVAYNIVIPAHVSLSIGQRIKRQKSGLLLTVISNPQDMAPPTVASEQIRYKCCTAEVVE